MVEYYIAALEGKWTTGTREYIINTAQETGAKFVLTNFYMWLDSKMPYDMSTAITNKTANILVDSGAFSAYNSNVTLSVDNYTHFIQKNKELIDLYANLDVIGDHVATERNMEYMIKQGLNPIQTYHLGEPIEVLHEYCNKYDYIGLGSSALVKGDKRKNFYYKCSRIIEHYGNKYHLWAVSDEKILSKIYPTSCDSSSWKYILYNGRFSIPHRKIEFHWSDKIATKKYLGKVWDKRPAGEDYDLVGKLNMKHYIDYQQSLLNPEFNQMSL